VPTSTEGVSRSNHVSAAMIKFPGNDARLDLTDLVSAVHRRLKRSVFADGEGAFRDFQFTGDDTFAGKNILTIPLEVPNDMLGSAFLHSCLHDVAEQAGRQLGQPRSTARCPMSRWLGASLVVAGKVTLALVLSTTNARLQASDS
jgi:hypothetical protein